MAIALERDFFGHTGFSASTAVAVPAAGCAAGNTVVVAPAWGSDTILLSSVTDSKGNTYTIHHQGRTGAGEGRSGAIASALLTTALVSGDTITATAASGTPGMLAICSEWSGLDAVSPFDKVAGQETAFGTSHSSGSTAATAVSDELVVGAHIYPDGVNAWTPTGGFTVHEEQNNLSGIHLVSQWKTVSSVGAQASTGTTANDTVTRSIVATFKAASGPPPDPPVATVAWLTA